MMKVLINWGYSPRALMRAAGIYLAGRASRSGAQLFTGLERVDWHGTVIFSISCAQDSYRPLIYYYNTFLLQYQLMIRLFSAS